MDSSVSGELDARLDELYSILEENTPLVRYNSWSRARQLASELQNHPSDGTQIPAASGLLTIPDVLNAAWLARRQLGEDMAAAVGRAAMTLCQQIAQRDTSQ